MSVTVRSVGELGNAISNKENRIIIEEKMGDSVITINAVGPVAWGIAIGAVGVAITGMAITTGTLGAGAPVGIASSFVAAPALITALGGTSVASTVICIAASGGGVGVLTSMRNYKFERINGHVVLVRR